jgi:hypothetical protein
VQQEGDSEALRPPWLRAPVPSVQLDQLHRQCRVARALGRLQPVEFSAPTVRGCEGRSVAPGDPGGVASSSRPRSGRGSQAEGTRGKEFVREPEFADCAAEAEAGSGGLLFLHCL